MVKKRALLVGINKYRESPLKGCVNDVILMYKILNEKYGFSKDDIVVLCDEEATRGGIIEELRHLTYDAKPGDTIYFHFSGHGSQVVSSDWTSSDEPDGFDEIICPVDMDWSNPLTDNTLNSFFIGLDKNVKSLVVLDCCHSGNGMRSYKNDIKSNRFLHPPVSNILSNGTINIDDDLNFILPKYNPYDIKTHVKQFIVTTSRQGHTVLITGCGENQTSADALIGGRYHGALTYYLATILKHDKYHITYHDLICKLNKRMDKNGFDQNPQLECKNKQIVENFMWSEFKNIGRVPWYKKLIQYFIG